MKFRVIEKGKALSIFQYVTAARPQDVRARKQVQRELFCSAQW
jgi:hypothetical protein